MFFNTERAVGQAFMSGSKQSKAKKNDVQTLDAEVNKLYV